MNFYNHALTAVKAGQNMLESLGLPIHRPHDFFCEHMKSDAHMARVSFFESVFLSPSYMYLIRLRID